MMSILDAFSRRPNIEKLVEKGKRKKLEKLLRHKSPYYRWRALIALMSISPGGEYVPVLKDFVARDEAGSIKQLGDFLGYASHPEVRVLAIDGCPVNYGLDDRSHVVEALAHIPSPAVIPLFLHILDDPEWYVRFEAAGFLRELCYEPSQIDREILVRALIRRFLYDPDVRVRGYAAKALGRFGDSAVLSDLDTVANDAKQDPDTRRYASEASAQIRNRHAVDIPKSIERVKEQPAFQCSKCGKALEEIGVPPQIQVVQMYKEVVNIGSEQVPEEIKNDPFVYRGFYCSACNKVFCPRCSNMQGEICPACNERRLMPAYRPLLKKLNASSTSTAIPMKEPSPAVHDNNQQTVGEIFVAFMLKHDQEITLEVIDVLRSIVNSNFAKDKIQHGVQHRNYHVRKLTEQFLSELHDSGSFDLTNTD